MHVMVKKNISFCAKQLSRRAVEETIGSRGTVDAVRYVGMVS